MSPTKHDWCKSSRIFVGLWKLTSSRILYGFGGFSNSTDWFDDFLSNSVAELEILALIGAGGGISGALSLVSDFFGFFSFFSFFSFSFFSFVSYFFFESSYAKHINIFPRFFKQNLAPKQNSTRKKHRNTATYHEVSNSSFWLNLCQPRSGMSCWQWVLQQKKHQNIQTNKGFNYTLLFNEPVSIQIQNKKILRQYYSFLGCGWATM